MIRCSQCSFGIPTDDSVCPRCGQVVDAIFEELESVDERMIKIARFTNAAEAGYFAHELVNRSGIDSQVLAEEDFDALSGFWSTRFALLVDETDLSSARQMLQQMIADDDTEQISEHESRFEPVASDPSYEFEQTHFEIVDPRDLRDGATEEAGVNWIPIVLTLAAGSVVFWAARKIHDQPNPAVMAAPGGHHRSDLWDQLTKDEIPWVQQLPNGTGKRELRINPDRRVITVREDLNGDGVFETETPFDRAALQR